MKALFAAAALFALVACGAKTESTTVIKFDHTEYAFGKVQDGEKVSHRYTFVNVGTVPLKIESVKPTCGCTTPDWTKDEIAPGAAGFVLAEFDSKGRTGVNNKTIQVFANTDPQVTVLKFSAEVTGGTAH